MYTAQWLHCKGEMSVVSQWKVLPRPLKTSSQPEAVEGMRTADNNSTVDRRQMMVSFLIQL